MKFFALVAAVAANQYDSMNEDELLVNLESTLSSALSSEARGDGDAAVAKTAAIKNIQKALTARILKRLDDGQPLVEVARKMKAIEGMQPQINDMERRLGIMQSVEPVLENAIKTLQKVVDVRGMGKKWDGSVAVLDWPAPDSSLFLLVHPLGPVKALPSRCWLPTMIQPWNIFKKLNM